MTGHRPFMIKTTNDHQSDKPIQRRNFDNFKKTLDSEVTSLNHSHQSALIIQP